MARERKTKAKKLRNRKLWLIFGGIGVVLAAVAVLLFLLLQPIDIDSISFDEEEIRLKAGERLILAHSYLPEDATETELSFKSSNRAVATVQNGILTAVSEGSCYISVTAESGAKDTLHVRVEAPMVKQEEDIVGQWRIFAVQKDGELRHIYNDDSSLSLTAERSGHLVYGKEEISIPDWRFTGSRDGYDYFAVKDEARKTWQMYFCTDSGSAYAGCLMLQLPDGELLLFRLEKEPE